MTLNTFIYLGIIIFAGMFFGRMAKHIKLPNVTGYLLGGLIIGPCVAHILPREIFNGLDLISDLALGLIAFSIGNEFKFSYFKRVGVTPIIIAIFESLFAVVFVVLALLISGHSLAFSLVLGSIASATAPASTIMVIKQYKAKGSVTETLLSVVALDDAVALILFGLSVAVARSVSGTEGAALASVISPLMEIGGALLVGLVLGLVFTIPLRFFKRDGNRLSLTLAFIMVGIGIAKTFDFSPLLLCMAMGATLANLSKQTGHIMSLADAISPPIYILFFVTSGAELELSVLPTIGIIGIIYVVFRFGGKVFGAFFGATLCKSEKKIKKYLGLALIPQEGVAIGLSLAAATVVPEYAQQIRAVILCGTLICEIIGPVLSKLALIKAGEITQV